jgi:small subunit ribosomal protein S8
MTDTISDMIVRIKNAYKAKHEEVDIPHSKEKEKLAMILKEGKYLRDVRIEGNKKNKKLTITLLYKGKIAAIDGMERISKPGRRIYSKWSNIPKTLGGFGTTIISTSRGLMTEKQANKEKIGGEIVCKVW